MKKIGNWCENILEKYIKTLYNADKTSLLFVPLGMDTVTVYKNAEISDTAFSNTDTGKIEILQKQALLLLLTHSKGKLTIRKFLVSIRQ